MFVTPGGEENIRVTVGGGGSPIATLTVSSVLIIKAVLKLSISYVWMLASSTMNMLVLPKGSYAIHSCATYADSHTQNASASESTASLSGSVGLIERM